MTIQHENLRINRGLILAYVLSASTMKVMQDCSDSSLKEENTNITGLSFYPMQFSWGHIIIIQGGGGGGGNDDEYF